MVKATPGGVTSLGRRRRFQWKGLPLFYTIVLLIIAFIVLYPLILLLYNSMLIELPDGSKVFSTDNWRTAWSQTGILESIWNTFLRVGVTELIAFPVGILVVWLLTRTDIPKKNWLDFFFWIAFFLPTLPVVMGWILLFDPDFGLMNQLFKAVGFEQGPFNIYSFWGIIFIHLVTRSIAAKYIFLAPAFRNMDASMEEASRMSGVGNLATLVKIVVPVLTPAILVTLIISLINSLESFETELLLGPPFNFYVFSTKIYQLIYQDPPLFGPATVLGVVILLSMLPLIIYQHWISTHRNFTTVTSHFRTNVLRLGRAKWPATVGVILFGLFMTVIPIIFLFMGSFMTLFGFFNLDQPWTVDHWQQVLTDPILVQSIWNTVKLAGGTALLGVIVYSVVAYITVRTKYRWRGPLDFVSWLPAAIPGVILGLGLLWMFLGVPFFRPLYGTVGVLILATFLTGMTTGVQLIKSNMVQLGYELEEASYISGGSWLYTFRRVMIPILTPAILSVATLTFVTAARNVAHIAMLVTANNRPIAMLQLDYSVDGRYEAAAIVGIIAVFMTTGVALIARLVGGRFGIRF